MYNIMIDKVPSTRFLSVQLDESVSYYHQLHNYSPRNNNKFRPPISTCQLKFGLINRGSLKWNSLPSHFAPAHIRQLLKVCFNL